MVVRGSGGGYLVSHFAKEGMEPKGINCMKFKKGEYLYFDNRGLED